MTDSCAAGDVHRGGRGPVPGLLQALVLGIGLLCLSGLVGAQPAPPPSETGERDGFSLSGHTRQRLTYLDDFNFGLERPDGDWFYTHRYSLVGRWQADRFTVLTDLTAAYIEDSTLDFEPVEENRGAVQRAWLGYDLMRRAGRRLTLTVGRDEWRFGSQRLVGWRDGTNVRRRFDGARLHYRDDRIDVQALAGFEVENDSGSFDDDIASNRALWGVYTVIDLSADVEAAGTRGLDLYYLGFFDEAAAALAQSRAETRHSLGARLWGEAAGFDWDFEAVYQIGDTGSSTEPDGDIRAWTLAGIAGYRFGFLPLKPRLALSANVASGDGDPADTRTTGFNALFPRGSYFSEVAQLGPRNFFNINPYLTLTLSERLTLTTDVNLYWRLRRADGVYDPIGMLVAEPGGSQRRRVSTAVSANLEARVSRSLFLGLLMTVNRPGAFIRETRQTAQTIHFLEATVRVDF